MIKRSLISLFTGIALTYLFLIMTLQVELPSFITAIGRLVSDHIEIIAWVISGGFGVFFGLWLYAILDDAAKKKDE